MNEHLTIVRYLTEYIACTKGKLIQIWIKTYQMYTNQAIPCKGGHRVKKVTKLRTFSVRGGGGGGGGGAQPHSIAFGGVFPNIIEAILVDEISTK